MTYGEALSAGIAISWNIGTDDAGEVHGKLSLAHIHLQEEHPDYPGRSTQLVADFNELWRGKVTTLLKWFQTKQPSVKGGRRCSHKNEDICSYDCYKPGGTK